VISYAAFGLTPKPNEKWFYTLADADNEVRRRIQVRRLNKRARVAERQYWSGRTWDHDGLKWHSVGATDYRNVPESHPDYKRSGGCKLHEVRAEVEDRPFDPRSLRFETS
jgi:hypothetical protein